MEHPKKQPGRFATTQWSIVISAGNSESLNSREALESLCNAYWFPLYAYAQRRVSTIEEAQDLTQAFFLEFLEKDYIGYANPDRGRFRSFLLTSFKNFMSNQREKASALKRGGGKTPISLNFDSPRSSLNVPPSSTLTPEEIYDQQWAIALLDRILIRLHSEFDVAGKSREFELLKVYVIGDHSGTTYAEVAKELKISEAAAKKAASRMRSRYRKLLRDEIAQTVSDEAEIDDEIRGLFSVLRK